MDSFINQINGQPNNILNVKVEIQQISPLECLEKRNSDIDNIEENNSSE